MNQLQLSAELFPLRVITGDRFCNRQTERKFLKERIRQKQPVVLISPRRYGKTSLATRVVEELQYPFCAIDLLTAYDDNAICTEITRGVSELFSKIMPVNMKTIQLIENCFRGVRAIIRSKYIDIEFSSALDKTDPVRQVLETLRGLENLSKKLKKTVVVFIDEFQRIVETPKGIAIQGAIRNVAQMAKHAAFLFSGSSRHLLTTAFDQPEAPLYMMCKKLNLGRIASKDYIPYIQDAAEIKWHKSLSNDILQRIFILTENHPFYINYLCGQLWDKNKPPQTLDSVDTAWQECLLSEERRLSEALENLTILQRVLLKGIAKSHTVRNPTAAEFLSGFSMSSSTAVSILATLRKKDFIYVDAEGNTCILDPLLKTMLTTEGH